MDNKIIEEIELLKKQNKKLKRMFNIFAPMVGIAFGAALMQLFPFVKKNYISFEEDGSKQRVHLGLNNMSLEGAGGKAEIINNSDETQELRLSNSLSEELKNRRYVWIGNKKDFTQISLNNKSSVVLSANEQPELRLRAENDDYFKIGFSEMGAPQLMFWDSNKQERLTVTIDDFKKLKKLNF